MNWHIKKKKKYRFHKLSKHVFLYSLFQSDLLSQTTSIYITVPLTFDKGYIKKVKNVAEFLGSLSLSIFSGLFFFVPPSWVYHRIIGWFVLSMCLLSWFLVLVITGVLTSAHFTYFPPCYSFFSKQHYRTVIGQLGWERRDWWREVLLKKASICKALRIFTDWKGRTDFSTYWRKD